MKTKLIILNLFVCYSFFGQQKLEVFFDFNQYDINPIANQKLEDWIEYNKKVEVLKIYGYCDWVGSHAYNDTLSMKRVRAVFNFLKNRKVTIKEQYEMKGFGKDFEQSNVQSDNRKVTVLYQKIEDMTPKPIVTTAAEELKDKIKSAKKGAIIPLKNLYFFNNSPRLLPKSKPVLEELWCAMNENPNLKIEIQGHICCQTVQNRFDVSSARARAVYVYLIQNKIDRKRLSFKGYGNTRPIHPIPEKTEEEEEENRRVEILINSN